MIIKLEPIPVKKIWGGKKLSKNYNFSIQSVGEIWGISGHKSKSNIISSGPYKGMTLRDFYFKYRKFFGFLADPELPIILKVIDAKEDLSVQVHPDNRYANLYEKSLGKDECWFILETKKNSRIQIGHNAISKKEMIQAIESNKITNKLIYRPLKKNDKFYIASGVVHAICKNTTLLEVSQSSDITYRIHDYNRFENGQKRQLNIKKALDVMSFPDKKNIIKEKYFSLKILNFIDTKRTSNLFGDYIYVVSGSGLLNNEKISKGEFIFISSNFEYKISGDLKLAIVNIKKTI